MNYYTRELQRIKESCFSNEAQLTVALNAKRYIDENFAEEVNLTFLSRTQLTSKYHLIRIFKRYFGITPRQYLINKRIGQAKKLLRSGMSVSRVCYEVGFTSINSFSTLFKVKTGVPPSVYKRATFDKSVS